MSSSSLQIGSELVPSVPGSRAPSAAPTPKSSFIFADQLAGSTKDLSYSFINSEFLDDVDMELPRGFRSTAHTYKTTSTSAFRNMTSTPRSHHPTSLPKSLPIDWNLFNKQFELNQKLKLSKLKRKRTVSEEFENNFENLPYHVIDFISDCVESQSDLINWSQTCRFFNRMVNKRLYSHVILVDNISDRCKHYDGKYTLVDSKNYPKFLASLCANDELVPLVNEIVIDTSSNHSSYDSLDENIYAALYDIFLTQNNNLDVLQNLDYNNLKKFDSLLNYNRAHLIKHNYNKYTDYYHESENMEDLIRRDLLHLTNFQLLDLNDINRLPVSAKDVSFALEHEFQRNAKFQLTLAGWDTLQRLTTLKLHTPYAFDQFLKEAYRFRNSDTYQRLGNITTLSIANIHKVDDRNQESRLSFHKLNSVIDLSRVEALELKLKCHERVQCNYCIMQFMTDWFEELLSNDHSNLKKLSLISLPPSSNYNVNTQWDSILCNANFLEKLGENLEFFFINLNDFPYMPIFEKTSAQEVQDSLKLPINESILKIRKLMYTNIVHSFKKLELLVMPDYFYNWAVYNNISDLSRDENVNFLNFLDSCLCNCCCEGRQLFKEYSRRTAFKDFKGRFQTEWRYNQPQAVTSYNKLNDNPDSYRILFNYMIRELKNRIPLKQVNTVQSSLDYHKFVPNVYSKYAVIPEEDFLKLTKLITHGLRKDVQRLLDALPNLKRINFGGVLFKCFKISKDKVRVKAMYDDFEEIFNIVQ